MTKKIAIIGCGIKGVSQAAALAQYFSDDIHVVVFDDLRNEGETSFSGTSRAHSGGSSMLLDPTEITIRKYVGQSYLNVLGALDRVEQAVYGFAKDARYNEFMAKAAVAGVPFKSIDPENIDPELRRAFHNNTDQFALVFEHPTNFTRIRYGMLEFLRQFSQNFSDVRNSIRRIEKLDNHCLRLFDDTGKSAGDFDLVINSAGRFAAQIEVMGQENQHPLRPEDPIRPDISRNLEITQARWPFFFVELNKFSKLPDSVTRILTHVDNAIDEKGNLSPYMATFNVHKPEKIVTLDTKSPDLERSDDPNQLKSKGPILSISDRNQLTDRQMTCLKNMFDKICEVFPIIGKNNITIDDVGIVYGVHGRTFDTSINIHSTPSDIMEVYQYDKLENYLIPFGGLATSSVYDAFTIADRVARILNIPTYDSVQRLQWLMESRLPDQLQTNPIRSNENRARWERT